MITFIAPDHLGNKQLERFLIAIEEAVFGVRDISPFVRDTIAEVVEQHGAEAAQQLVGSWVLSAITAVPPCDPPEEMYYRRRAMRLRGERFPVSLQIAEMQQLQRDRSHHHGRLVVQCPGCGSVRRGRKWKHRKLPSDDWRVLSVTCPGCEAKDDEAEKADWYQRHELTETDLNAWLGEPESNEPEA